MRRTLICKIIIKGQEQQVSTILVTGSAGFIGFHVSKALLDSGHKVVGVDNFNELISSATGIIVAIAGTISMLISLYGLIRRIFFKTAGLGAYKK
jgi:NAD(P)-dependent dehydrogenase (short-subunit alcohol dehydrogenase family)